jgi:hypothetical protein
MQAQDALLESQRELREANAMLNELSVRGFTPRDQFSPYQLRQSLPLKVG